MAGDRGRALDELKMTQEAKGCRKHLLTTKAEFYRSKRQE